MRHTLRGFVAVAALLLASTAMGGIGPNGLGPNGLGPNGLGPNGLGPNGLGPNGLGPNGLGPNGLGPNGLGPNGLGPNGLGPNGLDVNGLGPNGLGPNGVSAIYVVSPAGVQLDREGKVVRVKGRLVPVASNFSTWFDADPAAAAQYMRYFARCAYDAATAIAWLDSTGKTWVWTGQYGLAMGSLSSSATEPLSPRNPSGPRVRARMTATEGRWVSACLLAHVNTKGTHQYLSVRTYGPNAPNPAAASALARAPAEHWTMAENFGAFLGDLFAVDADGAPAPVKYACSNGTGNAYRRKVENALGRSCDLEPCTFVDAAGVTQPILTEHIGMCEPKEDPADPVTHVSPGTFTISGVTFDPVQVSGPDFRSLAWDALDLSTCGLAVPPASCAAGDARFDVPVDFLGGQRVACPNQSCVGNTGNSFSDKIVRLGSGQGLQVTHVNPIFAEPSILTETFTAIVRYTKSRTGAANLWASTATGGLRDVNGLATGQGPDSWPATGTEEQYEWLQVYPVFAYTDPEYATPAVRLRVAGADEASSCTGAKLRKGDGETGTCTNPLDLFFDWNHLKVACRERSQAAPACRGELILDYRNRRWGWFCAYGGTATYACLPDDAPDLDTVGFVPGAPWCMPAGATEFVGVCK